MVSSKRFGTKDSPSFTRTLDLLPSRVGWGHGTTRVDSRSASQSNRLPESSQHPPRPPRNGDPRCLVAISPEHLLVIDATNRTDQGHRRYRLLGCEPVWLSGALSCNSARMTRGKRTITRLGLPAESTDATLDTVNSRRDRDATVRVVGSICADGNGDGWGNQPNEYRQTSPDVVT